MSKNIYNNIYSPSVQFKIPDFLNLQRLSFQEFLKNGLITEFKVINRISNSSKTIEIEFHADKYKLNPPLLTAKQAILKRKTYACHLFIPIQITNYKTKQTILKWVFLANLPLMTKSGHFILNGSPKIIMNQIVRSPGLYFQKSIKSDQQVTYSADFIAQRGAWLRLEVDNKKGEIWAKVKRAPKMPIFVFLRCLGLKLPTLNNYLEFYNQNRVVETFNTTKGLNFVDNHESNSISFLNQLSNVESNFTNSSSNVITNHLTTNIFDLLQNSKLAKKESLDFAHESKITFSNSEQLFSDFFKIVYPKSQDGTVDFVKSTKKFLYRKFLNPRMYNLSPLGRYRINQKLGLDIPLNHTVLTAKDILFASFYLIECLEGNQIPSDIDDLKNRKIKPSGELIQTQFAMGLLRFEKSVREKLILSEKLNKNIIFSNTLKLKDLTYSKTDISSFFTSPFYLQNKTNFDLNVQTNQVATQSVDVSGFESLVQQQISKKVVSFKLPFIFEFSQKRNSNYQPLFQSKANKTKKLARSFSKGSNLTKTFTEDSFLSSKSLKIIESSHYFGEKDFLPVNLTNFEFLDHKKSYSDNRKNKGWPTTNTVSKNRTQTENIVSKLTAKQNQKLENLLTAKPLNSALREFFGTNPLAQLLDQTNPLSEITHKRRLSCLGPGGISRDTAGMAIRGIHPTHYGRICPIETPEGQNAGLVNSFTIYSNLNNKGFIETPFYQVYKGFVLKNRDPFLFSSDQEQFFNLAPGDIKITSLNFLPTGVNIPTRQLKEFKRVPRNDINFIALSPIQMISIATSLIPFLEHDDGNRALMGSNMQRQAVPTIKPSKPIVGTGLESRVISDVNYGLQAQKSGFVSYVDGKQIIIYSNLSNVHNGFKRQLKDQGVKQFEISSNRKLFTNLVRLKNSKSSLIGKPFLKPLPLLQTVKPKFQNLFGYQSIHFKNKSYSGQTQTSKDEKTQIGYGLFTTMRSKKLYKLSNIFFENNFLGIYELLNTYSTKPIYKSETYNYKPLISNRSLILIKQFYNKTVLLNYVNILFTLLVKNKKPFLPFNQRFKRSEAKQIGNSNLTKKTLAFSFINQQTFYQKQYDEINIKPLTKNLIVRSLNNPFGNLSVSTVSSTFSPFSSQLIKSDLLTFRSNSQISSIAKKQQSNVDIPIKSISVERDELLSIQEAQLNLLSITNDSNIKKLYTQSFSKKFNLFNSKKLSEQKIVLSNFIKNLHQLPSLDNYKLSFTKDNIKASTLTLAPNYKTQATLKHFNTNDSISKFNKTVNSINSTFYKLDEFHRSNQDTYLVHRPIIKEGEWVQTGDVLADNSSSVQGELAIGQNLLVGYTPWEGYNFEDAVLISDRVISEDLFTTLHIERYEVEVRDTQFGIEQITNELPNESLENLKYLDSQGIAKIGTWVHEGDVLVGKVAPLGQKKLSPYEKLLYDIIGKQIPQTRDTSLRVPLGVHGRVVHIEIIETSNVASQKTVENKKLSVIDQNQSLINSNSSPSRVKNLVKGSKNLRHNRSMTSGIQFTELQKLSTKAKKRLKTFNAVSSKKSSLLDKSKLTKKSPAFDILDIKKGPTFCSEDNLNLNIYSSNTRQINSLKQNENVPLKVHIYLAEKRKIQVGDKIAGRHGNKGIISNILPRQDMPYLPDGTPLDLVLNPLGVPSRMNVGQIFECLLGLAGSYLGQYYKIQPFDEIYGCEASRSLVYSKLYEARIKTGQDWLFDPNFPGKVRLFDGRTGECFEQPVTVGKAYILKLVHLVDEKIHARSTGPYSLVTQQPLRGRSKQGGQRVGEMEVWALEGFGAAYILQELLTIKSDDIKGRNQVMKSILNNEPLTFGTPESFKVLVRELQSLCLDIAIYKIGQKGKPIQIDLVNLP